MLNKMRWSGKLLMMRQFLHIQDELLEVSTAPDTSLSIDGTVRFESKVKKYKGMLEEIEVVSHHLHLGMSPLVTKSLQTRGYTLPQCRGDLDVLVECVDEEKNNSSSAPYQCKLGTKYISQTAPIVQHPDFESAVVKIQKGLADDSMRKRKEQLPVCAQISTRDQQALIVRMGL